MESLHRDPVLSTLVDEHGPLELEPAPDGYRRLVRSIISQQLSTSSARAIRARVFDRFEVTPEGILAADEQALRDAGLSRQKIGYIRSAADAFLEHDLSPTALESNSDQEVIDLLTSIRGIGVWTAKMYLMFGLAREDVFPVEDLGIRNGMELLYGEMSRDEMVQKAQTWKPYRSYASMYLWRAVD
ncbi:MAG: DNA-3-methyladenine glycosylase family protein [Halobacteriota archaeon]